MGKFLPFLSDFGSFWSITLIWSLFLAENFQKSNSKFVEGYMTTRTHEKIQNQGLRSTYRSACAPLIVNFLSLLEFLEHNFKFCHQFWLKTSKDVLLSVLSSGTCGKIQNLGFYGPKWVNFCHF